jgi:Na+-driven multidrug efflux pump
VTLPAVLNLIGGLVLVALSPAFIFGVGPLPAFGIEGAAGGSSAVQSGYRACLEFVMIPLLFGLGTAIVIMVGTNMGAGQATRARHIARVGVLLAAAVTEVIGLFITFAPIAWLVQPRFRCRCGG